MARASNSTNPVIAHLQEHGGGEERDKFRLALSVFRRGRVKEEDNSPSTRRELSHIIAVRKANGRDPSPDTKWIDHRKMFRSVT